MSAGLLITLFNDDDDDDEIAYFTVRWKTRKLVLSTAPKTWDNTDKDSSKEMAKKCYDVNDSVDTW